MSCLICSYENNVKSDKTNISLDITLQAMHIEYSMKRY